jgi:hypothetical protein
MVAWITDFDVAALLQTDLSGDNYIDQLIVHAQGLAEVEIGTQSSPSQGIKSVLAQIVARMWQAGQSAKINPAALAQQEAGPFRFENPNAGAAGLGLTNREKALLRKAAGKSDLYVQPTTRGDVLETPPSSEDRAATEQLVDDASGGDPIVWFAEEDLPA